MPETQQRPDDIDTSVTAWPALLPFVAFERRIGERMAARPATAFAYEFLRFGIKQAWACLFGGMMVALLVGTYLWYPSDIALARYDFLFLAALGLQALLLIFRLETMEEAKVIIIYHVIGTVMEIFKTSVGSWIYPEPNFFRIAGVPLFSGFMYSCIGSYLCRAWRLFHFEFSHHPPAWALGLLSLAIYVNFFSHHYVVDIRILLFLAAAALFWRTTIYFANWRSRRSMPLLLGLFLVSVFIWISENAGTFSRAWIYPTQVRAWSMVGFGKLGSWFLLLLVSYSLVFWIKRPGPGHGLTTAAPGRQP
jgi:uncharacterized membrane protein YoaT (DUF817 family)